MGLLIENFKMAISAIKANKMRTILTMLGMIIGISSVIAIASVGDATTKTMESFFQGFGQNRTMIVMSFKDDEFPSENQFFSFEDIEKLKEKFPKEINYISSQTTNNLTVKKGDNETNIVLYAVNYNYMKELAPTTDIIHGRDFMELDVVGRKNNIIVEVELAMELFGKEDVVGEQLDIKVNGEVKPYNIIGVSKKEKTIFDNLNTGGATFVALPYTLMEDSFTAMEFKIADEFDPKKITEKIRKFITRYKRVDNDFYEIRTLDEQAKMFTSTLGTVSLGLGAIAAISLLVGGIGIMNIMLVSVTERTKEIGIRKSLGARKKDILTQFLVESVILSGVGGIIGTIFGLLFSMLISNFMNVSPTTPIIAISIAVGFSFFVGMFFGIFPAYKASSLDPIDALRYE